MPFSTSQQIGTDGVPLAVYRWQPEQPPRAIVLLAHGLGEHAGRYAPVARVLNQRGFVVAALDHRGHGRSGGEPVMIDDFGTLATDFGLMGAQARADFPNLPLFVYGHSMGTLVTLLYVFDHQDELAGVVLTGCALRPASFTPVNILAARVLKSLMPRARVLPALDAAAISRDPAVVAAYDGDPLVYRGKLPVCLGSAGLEAVQTCERRLPELRLPILALHGTADRLTLPAGTRLLAERAPAAAITVHLWEGLYHEVHNEPEQAAVLDMIAGWLESRLGL